MLRICDPTVHACWVLGLCLMTAGAWAQNPPPLGSEFQVNSYTTDGQGFPAVAATPGGGFVVTWQGYGSLGDDLDNLSVNGQRYGDDGTPVGSEFQVNTYTTEGQFFSDVAVAPDGSFTVVWTSGDSLTNPGPDGDLEGIAGRRYDTAGLPVGDEFVVNSYTMSRQRFPKIATALSGDSVVVWDSFNASPGNDTSSWSVVGRLFAADGMPVGDDFQLNTSTGSVQRAVAVDVDSAGSFVAVWESFFSSSGSDDDFWSIQGQRFDAEGASAGGEFQVNSYITGDQRYPSVAVSPNGDFVVVWQSAGSAGNDASGDSIQGQRYASDGSPVGGEFQVNTFTTGNQRYARADFNVSGSFVVAWESGRYGTGPDGDGSSVQAQLFGPDGTAIGDEFQVNTFTTERQQHPAIAARASAGTFVVAWGSYASAGPDFDYSVQAQRFSDPAVIFTDGFESGDTVVWSLGANPESGL